MSQSIVALFDMSGHAVRDWAKAGWTCYCLDIINVERREDFALGGCIVFLPWDARSANAIEFVKRLQPKLLLCFPPCTDLAVSGAKHFASKREANPKFQEEALELVLIGPNIAEHLGCDYIVENPVGVLSRIWRSPDWYFDPCQFGGYLPTDDVHPEFPQYIVPRDAYEKKTCIWASKGVKKPQKRSVSVRHTKQGFNDQTSKLGGKSARTKMIRSLTPRGFARALFEANHQ